MNRELTPPSPWLRRYTKVVAASTLFLIFAGAMVTSTGSGLAVPDWPLSFGMLMPPMVGGIFYEHGHRMIAAAVGLLTLIQAIWLQRRDPRRFVRVLGWVAAIAVIVQGLLGGLTVIFLLPPAISIAHAGLAEIFFCLNVSIAFFSSAWLCSAGVSPAFGRGDRKAGGTPALHGAAPTGSATLLVALIYMQILAGALMRHMGAGLAIPDFPLSFGRVVPSFTSTAIAVNYAHRAGALIVAVAVVVLAAGLLRYEARHPLRRMAILLVGVIVAQVLLGAFTVWSGKQPVLTSLHVMTGALTLAISLVLCLVAHVRGRPQAQSSTVLVGRSTREVTA